MRPTHYISRYVPMRCKRAYAQEIRFRNFVLQFKNGNTAGERYVIFDDIITKGKTLTTIADYIESKGGEVIAGYFLGKTIWR